MCQEKHLFLQSSNPNCKIERIDVTNRPSLTKGRSRRNRSERRKFEQKVTKVTKENSDRGLGADRPSFDNYSRWPASPWLGALVDGKEVARGKIPLSRRRLDRFYGSPAPNLADFLLLGALFRMPHFFHFCSGTVNGCFA